jgi:hypothetical protein
MKMPIIRKVVEIGSVSRAIVLPKSWLDYYKRETGEEITHVAIEVNGKLLVRPYIKDNSFPQKAKNF